MPFSIGQNVGPYQILEQLGQGGMATVFKAYHPALDRYVAIKVLHAAFREDPSFAARFTREARVVAKLEHPNIVPIYDYSEWEGQPYLVMKFIEGETLKARLARGPLSAQEAMRIIDAVGAALSYAHLKGILHRDIKPSNVLLTPEGGIYLADFGLARIAQSGESTLSSDMLLGTPHYISPEQAQGLKNLDAGTDIYSLGVVMYELSVGRVPFNADTPFSIIHDHIFTPLPLPHLINPKVPEGVERVLLKALAKDRKDRFPDVKALVEAFETSIREALGTPQQMQEPISTVKKTAAPPAPPAGTKPAARKGIPKWVFVVAVIMACLCVCCGGLAVARNSDKKNQNATGTSMAMSRIPPVLQTETPLPVVGTEPIQDPNIPQDAQESWSHLLRGLDLLDAGKKDEAMQEFNKALDTMPADRTEVIRLAAQKLSSRGQWTMAGKFLQKGLTAHPQEPSLLTAAEEVFFHVAGQKDGEPLVRWLADAFPNWGVAQAELGRWLAVNSPQPKDGEPYIQRGKSLAQGEEALIVKAILGEYMCITGNTSEGIANLQEVQSDKNTPAWLKAEVERMITKWKAG